MIKSEFNCKLDNQRGFTFIEMMLTLVLLSVIVVVVSNILISSGQKKLQVGEQITLHQQTNLLATKMQEYYYNTSGVDSLPLQYNPNNLEIKELIINGESVSTNKPIDNVNFDRIFNMHMVTKFPGDTSDYETIIDTTWKPVERDNIEIIVEIPIDDD